MKLLKKIRVGIACVLLGSVVVLLLEGCGQSGPLYLAKKPPTQTHAS